jgi:hypothetical protein
LSFGIGFADGTFDKNDVNRDVDRLYDRISNEGAVLASTAANAAKWEETVEKMVKERMKALGAKENPSIESSYLGSHRRPSVVNIFKGDINRSKVFTGYPGIGSGVGNGSHSYDEFGDEIEWAPGAYAEETRIIKGLTKNARMVRRHSHCD